MASVDPRIIMQMMAPASVDFAGNFQKGMDMAGGIQDAQRESARNEAYKKNMIQNEDGTVGYNRAGLASDLIKGNNQKEAMAMQDRFSQKDAAKAEAEKKAQMEKMGMIAKVGAGIKDQESYTQGRNYLIQQGVLTEQDMPIEYDRGYVSAGVNAATSVTQQWGKENQDRNYGLSKQGLAIQREGLALRRQEAKAKVGEGQSKFERIVSGLSGEQKKRFDNIRMGKSSLDKMVNALAGGDNTFSMLGDNNFTYARTLWNEAIGRMQSGGAINAEEAVNFKNMVPGKMDSRAIQVTKLREMQSEMDRRLQSFSLKPEEVPDYLDPSVAGNLNAYAQNNPMNVPGINSANAMSVPQTMSGSQIEWAD